MQKGWDGRWFKLDQLPAKGPPTLVHNYRLSIWGKTGAGDPSVLHYRIHIVIRGATRDELASHLVSPFVWVCHAILLLQLQQETL
jgi:hypothetical protein